MLTPQELRAFSQPSAWNTWMSITVDWLLIAAAFAAAILVPHPLVYLAVAALIARQQLALAVLMHDGAHRRLFKAGGWNDFAGQVLCSAPLFFSMYSYKHSHLKHHLDPLAPDDPDLSLIGGYPISKASFARKLFRDLVGISYFKFIKYFIYMSRKRKASGEGVETVTKKVRAETDKLSPGQVGASIIGINLVILGALWAFGHPWIYVFFWLVPAMTVLQLYMRIRGIAEHAGYAQNENQMLNARTVVNPLQTFFVAPHSVNYHIEHHIYPSVPHFRLREVHRLMSDRGVLPEKNVYRGYGRVLAELIR